MGWKEFHGAAWLSDSSFFDKPKKCLMYIFMFVCLHFCDRTEKKSWRKFHFSLSLKRFGLRMTSILSTFQQQSSDWEGKKEHRFYPNCQCQSISSRWLTMSLLCGIENSEKSIKQMEFSALFFFLLDVNKNRNFISDLQWGKKIRNIIQFD